MSTDKKPTDIYNKEAESRVVNHYPERIKSEKYRDRSMFLIVKNSPVREGIEELKALTQKVSGFAQDLVGKDVNVNTALKELTADQQPVWGVQLPMPNELTDSTSHDWDTDNSVLHDIASGVLNKGGLLGKIAGGKGMGELASVGGFRKPLLSPGYYQNYAGTKPRSISFSWDLIANNKKEADQIADILYALKKYTLPNSIAAGTMLLSPYAFELSVNNRNINDLLGLNDVVCTNMSVNYSADGALQYLPDGTPKHMKLTLDFTERSTRTADMYGNRENQ